MNKLILLLCLITTGFVRSLESTTGVVPDNSSLSLLHSSCGFDVQKLCLVDALEESVPFEILHGLLRLSPGQKSYPVLKYGTAADMCMWNAFSRKEITKEECYNSLKARMEDFKKESNEESILGSYEGDVIRINVPFTSDKNGNRMYFLYRDEGIWFKFLLSYSVASYLALSKCDLSLMSIALTSLYIAVCTFNLFLSSSFIGLGGSVILMAIIFLSPKDKKDDDQQDGEDWSCSRLDDDERVYVAVPASQEV